MSLHLQVFPLWLMIQRGKSSKLLPRGCGGLWCFWVEGTQSGKTQWHSLCLWPLHWAVSYMRPTSSNVLFLCFLKSKAWWLPGQRKMAIIQRHRVREDIWESDVSKILPSRPLLWPCCITVTSEQGVYVRLVGSFSHHWQRILLFWVKSVTTDFSEFQTFVGIILSPVMILLRLWLF